MENFSNEPKDYEIVIEGDTNDADYVHSIRDISLREIEEIIKPAIELIKAHKGKVPFHEFRNNWPDNYLANIDLIETFQEYCPCGEYGIHSIESVTFYKKPKKIRIF
jgi:hypothetical protein